VLPLGLNYCHAAMAKDRKNLERSSVVR